MPKKLRTVELGWLNYDSGIYKQVRTRRGGGTLKVQVDFTQTVGDFLAVAEELFFPNGTSVLGPRSQYDTIMGGFDGCPIESQLTIDDVYKRTKLKMLRMYLLTKRVVTNNSTSLDLSDVHIPVYEKLYHIRFVCTNAISGVERLDSEMM